MVEYPDCQTRPLRFGLALAGALLLAGSPALAESTAACEDEWEESSASDTCKEPNIQFGDWNNCLQCCNIFAKCHTGNNFDVNPWHLDGIGVPLSEVDDLQNCRGYLRVGSC